MLGPAKIFNNQSDQLNHETQISPFEPTSLSRLTSAAVITGSSVFARPFINPIFSSNQACFRSASSLHLPKSSAGIGESLSSPELSWPRYALIDSLSLSMAEGKISASRARCAIGSPMTYDKTCQHWPVQPHQKTSSRPTLSASNLSLYILFPASSPSSE